MAGRGGVFLALYSLIRSTADWFGVSKGSDAPQKWQRKSLRHCSLRYGKLKPQALREMDLPSQDNISLASTETPPPLYLPPCPPGMQRVGSLGVTWLWLDGVSSLWVDFPGITIVAEEGRVVAGPKEMETLCGKQFWDKTPVPRSSTPGAPPKLLLGTCNTG